MEKKIFRWAIMGAGGIAEKFCDAVNRLENAEVAAVASKTMERAKGFVEKNHIECAFDNYEQMLKEVKPDGVYIATTPNSHYELTMLCLDYKTPVLCEKAMFLSSQQACSVFDRSKELGVFVMEGMWSRFLPHNQMAKKWLAEGMIGDIELAEISIGFAAEKNPENRFYNPVLGGGAAFDITVYCFELMTYFIEEKILEIKADVTWADTGVDKTEQIAIRFENCMANLHASIAANLEDHAVIYGTKGKIVIPLVHYGTQCCLYQNHAEPVHFEDDTENGFVFEIQEAMECIGKGEIESSIAPHKMTIQCSELFDLIMSQKLKR